MKLAMIGLGRMGMNMARRLLRGGHEVVAYNRSPEKSRQLADEDGALAALSLQEVVDQLPSPRIVWLMLPAGATVDQHISQFSEILDAGDILIDGGNTYYKDDIRRSEALREQGFGYVDVGEKQHFDQLEPVFQTLAPPEGYLYCGPSGAGHFVKMVHNGIEYGLMQAYGEGFEILEASPYREHFDYQEIAHLWNQGSVVRSWLLELLEPAFAKDPRLTDIQGYVEDSGEGRWTLQQAIETDVPAEVIALSLMRRFRSRQENTFTDRVLAALRREFGGHAVKPTN